MKHWWERRDPLRIEPRIARVGAYVVDVVCVIALIAFGIFVVTARASRVDDYDRTPLDKALALAGIVVILGRWVFRGVRPSRQIAERMDQVEEEEEGRVEKLDETWQFRKH